MEVLGDVFIRVTGPCYVGMGMTLILCVVFLLVTVILPLTQDFHTLTGLVSLFATVFVFFNIVFNYVMSIRTRPGSPLDQDVQMMCAEAGGMLLRRWCNRCRCYKPELTHHCRVCKVRRGRSDNGGIGGSGERGAAQARWRRKHTSCAGCVQDMHDMMRLQRESECCDETRLI